jgi:hypothetical protein
VNQEDTDRRERCPWVSELAKISSEPECSANSGDLIGPAATQRFWSEIRIIEEPYRQIFVNRASTISLRS